MPALQQRDRIGVGCNVVADVEIDCHAIRQALEDGVEICFAADLGRMVMDQDAHVMALRHRIQTPREIRVDTRAADDARPKRARCFERPLELSVAEVGTVVDVVRVQLDAVLAGQLADLFVVRHRHRHAPLPQLLAIVRRHRSAAPGPKRRLHVTRMNLAKREAEVGDDVNRLFDRPIRKRKRVGADHNAVKRGVLLRRRRLRARVIGGRQKRAGRSRFDERSS